MEKESIRKYLVEAGIRKKSKAFFYLEDVIISIPNQDAKLLPVYKYVAEKHGVKPWTIEEGIRYEINRAGRENGYNSCNKEFIRTAVSALRNL